MLRFTTLQVKWIHQQHTENQVSVETGFYTRMDAKEGQGGSTSR